MYQLSDNSFGLNPCGSTFVEFQTFTIMLKSILLDSSAISLSGIRHLILIGLVCSLALPVSAQEEPAAVEAEASAEEEAPGVDPAVLSEGETLFNNNCTVCHAVNNAVVGPALKGVEDRWEDQSNLVAFIQNSQKVIQGGNEYAVNLYEEYNQTQMPSFDFSVTQVESILAYINDEASKQAAAAQADAGDGEGAVATGQAAGEGINSEYLTIVLIGLLVVLVLILLVLALIVSVLTKFLNQKDLTEEDKEVVNQNLDLKKLAKSKAFLGIMVFIFVSIAIKGTVDGLYSVGIQQGYAPTQPIAFSHALHAGQYNIQCQYCHTGVMKAKSANIPSANICMNCHQQVKTESPEIQKIYAAIDFDSETQTYGQNQQPIEWVRVHNLPDLAYFNHAQHVNVGGLECETCHGNIQEMEVVYQYSKLTMGWCINCHRETQVNAKDNAYYDKLLQYHEAEYGEETPMYVEDIGGLECSKCHY